MSAPTDSTSLAPYRAASEHLGRVRSEMARVIVGQQELIHRLMVGLVARGHILLEGLPGLAKTASVSALARATDCQFSRIQFTPDLLPGDITGTLIYDPLQGTYSTRQGPIFANLVLADEINRAPSKVQSALLEAEEELIILDRMASTRPQLTIDSVVKPEEISAYQTLVNSIHVDPLVRDYIVRLVISTREAASGSGVAPELKRLVRIGASPRATINLTLAARACALIEGRNYVTPEDVKRIALDVLRHRILLTYEAEAEEVTTESIVGTLLSKVKVP